MTEKDKKTLINNTSVYFAKQLELADDPEIKWLVTKFNKDIKKIIKEHKTVNEALQHATPYGVKVGE